MTYKLPLMGHDMPPVARKRYKATVGRVWTLTGPRWGWKHRCAWKGYVETNSYPLESWRVALSSALLHLKRCP